MEKAVFSLDTGSMGTCQYPLAKSNVVINLADDIPSSKSSILGMGKGSGLDRIQLMVIDTNPQSSVLFWNQHHWCSPWTVAGLDDAIM